MSQADIGKTLGVSHVTVGNYERGVYPNDFLHDDGGLDKIADVLDTNALAVLNNASRLSKLRW